MGAFWTAFYVLLTSLLISASAWAQAPDKEFTISVGETLTFSARGIQRVAIGLSSIADAQPTSDQKQIVLTGKAPGVTTVNIFSDRGQKTLLVRVVTVNPESLASEVRDIMGERSGVDVRVIKGRVLLEGEVASDIYKRKIEKLVELYPTQVLNFTTFREAFVEGARMVAMDLYFVQLATRDSDKLGLNWGQFLGANMTFGTGDVPLYYASGGGGGQQQNAFGTGILPGENNPARLPNAVSLTGGDGASYWSLIGNLNLAIDLMVEHGLIKEIKHGVIVTETGTEAEYLSGGTLLIRVVGGDSFGVVEKDYGLNVKLKPVLDFENKVKISVDAEFSELDYANGVGDLPALRKTNVKSTVNMQEGQSVLISTQANTINTSTESGFWLLSRIPILGWLFKSRTYLGTGLDNAIFITPRLYEPGGKTHRTLIQGAFETLLNSGAEANDLPELSNAQVAPATTKPAPKTEEKKPEEKGGEELLDE
ncbi:MAG: pilus assembly protein N-terminal domain-containing protein [bacterium]